MGQVAGFSECAAFSKVCSSIDPGDRCQDLVECLANPPASPWIRSPVRRLIDIAFALSVLLVLAAPMLLLAVCIRLTSPGRSLFAQQRVGLRGRLFKLYKFRSMSETPGRDRSSGLTRAGDGRVTTLGRFMRRFKIDELPQFWNVLRGDMSVIGPRPKLPRYATLFKMGYRPGITGEATLAFRHEEELMREVGQAELDDFYARHIKPVKARIDACYMCRATPISDLRMVARTFLSCLRPAAVPARTPVAPVSARVQPLPDLSAAQRQAQPPVTCHS